MLNLSRFKPGFWDYQDITAGPGRGHFSFRRRWLMIVGFTTVVTLTPLLVMALVDYRLTRQAFESEARMGISRMVSNTWRSISFIIAQRRAALQFVARDNPPDRLNDPRRLAEILGHLQSGMGGFLDLAVVDADCAVKTYAGPYKPEKDAIDPDDCFSQAVADGFFISDVTHRQGDNHHIVVAIRHDLADGTFFILRATLDANLMDAPVGQLVQDDCDDAFLVNRRGILQTPSRHFGKRFEKVPLNLPPADGGTQVTRTVDAAGTAILVGFAPIQGSPFALIMVRPESGIMDLWLRPRLRLIGFLIFSIVLILGSILGGATLMVDRLHTADRRRVQALHQVEYANKLASIGRLASGVAHEINNPLAIINQKTGLIKDLFTLNPAWGANEKLMGLVDHVMASVDRCAAITRRLLDFSRHMESSIETVDIETIIRQILAFMEKDAERRCIAIDVAVRGSVPPFEGDRGNLQQIFLNLINNAFAAMESGGRLEIAIGCPEPSQIRVTVTDTGPGIAEADQKRIFEPFFSTRQGHGGTGLGLSVTYGMVSEMGGNITVQSRLNEGTRFTVTLPLERPRPPSAAACAIEPSARPAADPFTEENRT
ncbi:ATP-binding protein [Desulfosarcina ovata]|uniref:histidine kinase n=1 Tax=Desulfosarcina ovata subsp. ovata TaxID=2752305 RepID=A0A5K8AHG8_9BACT|nr:ATP-binding protein [Desulfosarcina ovata]BBO92143.1 two-component sensor histidine kinase [Desulfosarcina ovata subsp. ovata]